jgi:hypothetical protein
MSAKKKNMRKRKRTPQEGKNPTLTNHWPMIKSLLFANGSQNIENRTFDILSFNHILSFGIRKNITLRRFVNKLLNLIAA